MKRNPGQSGTDHVTCSLIHLHLDCS